jgi:hypothetical protein
MQFQLELRAAATKADGVDLHRRSSLDSPASIALSGVRLARANNAIFKTRSVKTVVSLLGDEIISLQIPDRFLEKG